MFKTQFRAFKWVIVLLITSSEKWLYLAVKSLSRLLRGIRPNSNADYHCMKYLYSFRPEKKLRSVEKVCKDHNY